MPFQSEKQRRYLWANEPEIARDWTDTYGSGIAKALGGRIGFYRGSPHGGSSSSSSSSSGPGPGGQGARGQATQNPGAPSGPGPGGQGARGQATQNPGITTTRSRIQDERQEDFRKKQMSDLIARQQAEKDYTRQGIMKTGPQLGLAGSGIGGGGIKNFLGNWGSGLAGSKIGGGLGSMLFGPWGMLLGSLFGQGAGRRAYKASQTPEEETMKQILMPEFMQNLGLFDKRINEPPRGEGVETIDIRDKFNRRGDDFDITEERFAFEPNSQKDKKLKALHGERQGVLELQKQGLDITFDPKKEKEYQDLLKEDAEQTEYPKSVIT